MMFLMLDQQSHTSEFSAGLFTLRSLCLDPVCVCSVSFRTCSPLDVWALNLPSLSGRTLKGARVPREGVRARFSVRRNQKCNIAIKA